MCRAPIETLRRLLVTMAGCMSWQPGPAGPGTVSSDGTWQPGVSVPAASRARVPRSGRTLAFRSGERAWPRRGRPKILILAAVLASLLSVVDATSIARGPDRVYQQRAGPQERSASLSEKCPSDKEEIPPSSRTDGIQCQCKPGTFQDRNSPEMCQTCSLGCPPGKVVAKPCTPFNNTVCVDQESERVTTTPMRPTSPSPSTVDQWPGPGLGLGTAVLVVLVVVLVVVLFWFIKPPGSGAATSFRNRVFRYLRASRGPGALDSGRNVTMNSGDSLSMLASEEELEQREHAGLPGVMVQPAGAAEHLLA